MRAPGPAARRLGQRQFGVDERAKGPLNVFEIKDPNTKEEMFEDVVKSA